MAGLSKSMMRERRAMAFARALERRRRLDAVLREELAERRTRLQSLDRVLKEKSARSS